MHRGPFPPLVWRSCCPRSGHRLLAASPCHGLSPSPSPLSQSDCPGVTRSSSLCQRVRPSKPRLHPWALPCSSTIRETPAVGTHPGSTPLASPWRLARFCLPRRGSRVGDCTPDQWRGSFSRSLTFRPPFSLSTLRRARYRTQRKTRSLTAGSALSGPPSQTAGLSMLARRNPAQIPACGFSAPGSSMRLASAIPVSQESAIPLREVGLCAPARPVRHTFPVRTASHRHPLPPVDGSPAL